MRTLSFSRTAVVAVPLLVLTGGVGLVPAPAEAAYPGVSGRIFFQSDRDGNPHIYSMNPDGSRLVRLTTEGANTSPAVSPDGTRLAYVHDGDVWTMSIDGSDRLQVTDTPAAEATPAWSPDATRIAYVVRADGGTDLEIMFRASDGRGGATQMTDNAFPDTDPAWSSPLPGWPDGLIAFESARTGDSDRNIYVMDSGGGAIVNVTPPREHDGVPYQGHDDSPSWSPDGRIAFTHTFLPNAGGLPAVWTVSADGSGLSRLSTDPTVSASEPAWSPDGKYVAYVGTSGTDRNIALMTADASLAAFIDTATSHDIAPDWQEDSVDPQTTISAGPSGAVAATTATVAFTSDEPGSDFECSLDGQPFTPCTSPRTWNQLAVGAHGVRVRAVDPVGRTDASPATVTWTVQAAPLPAPPPTPTPVPVPTPVPTPVPPPPPAATAWVASTVRLDQTGGRVPAKVSVSPAGSRLEVRVLARVSGRWVRVGRRTSEVAQAGTFKVKVPIKPTWRLHLDGQRVKAKLVVAATAPSGATVHTAERFWLRG
jgi:Tol biopolymer transport system component